MRDVRSTMATRDALAAVREDVAEVKGDCVAIRAELNGPDGNGGLRARVGCLEQNKAHQNGLHSGRISGLRIGIALGLVAAGGASVEIIRNLVQWLGG